VVELKEVSTVDFAGMRWRRSSFSGSEGGGNDNCVEVAVAGGATALRDSKNVAGPVLVVSAEAFSALLTASRA
jgi:hypothetical protein